MIDYETRTQRRVDEAELKLARNFVENTKKEHPDIDYKKIIKKAASMLGLNDALVLKLTETYIK